MLSREQIQVCTLLVLASMNHVGFPGRSIDKESACNAGDSGSIPGWGRSPGGGNGNPLQCSCLEIPKERGEPGGLHFMGSQRVRHELVTNQQQQGR